MENVIRKLLHKQVLDHIRRHVDVPAEVKKERDILTEVKNTAKTIKGDK